MKTLFIIPARGGSKGIPHKNIRKLCGKPLIYYSIEAARAVAEDRDICVSTDDKEIINIVEKIGLEIPFIRPREFATDMATTNDVLCHALKYYHSIGRDYDCVVLLQPTSPLRETDDILNAMNLFNGIGMVVSVNETDVSSKLFQENEDSFLTPVFTGGLGKPRQETKRLYEYNGAIYIANAQEIMEKGLHNIDKRKKYVMPKERSIDIDNMADWEYAEHLMAQKLRLKK